MPTVEQLIGAFDDMPKEPKEVQDPKSAFDAKMVANEPPDIPRPPKKIADPAHEDYEAYTKTKQDWDVQIGPNWDAYRRANAKYRKEVNDAKAELEKAYPAYRAYQKAKEQYEWRKEISIWKYEKFLPALVPDKLFGTLVLFKLPGETVDLGAGVLGQELAKCVCVPAMSEAFGYLMYENCFQRWQNLHKYTQEHPNQKTPTYNKNQPWTEQFKAKWSDFQSGKGKKVSQWDPEALQVLEDLLVDVEAWRAKESEIGDPKWTAAQRLVIDKRKKEREASLAGHEELVVQTETPAPAAGQDMAQAGENLANDGRKEKAIQKRLAQRQEFMVSTSQNGENNSSNLVQGQNESASQFKKRVDSAYPTSYQEGKVEYEHESV